MTFVGYVTPQDVFTGYRLPYQIVRRNIEIDVAVDASVERVGSTIVSRPTWADRVPADELPA